MNLREKNVLSVLMLIFITTVRVYPDNFSVGFSWTQPVFNVSYFAIWQANDWGQLMENTR